MRTPAAAFAWELCHRHGQRLMMMAGLILAFILLYPPLCAMTGINVASANIVDEIAGKMSLRDGQGYSAHRVIVALYSLFVACGPMLAMFLSLFYVVWMFSLSEMNPKTNDAMAFPVRLFNLPVSTTFLFWWFFLGGQIAIMAVYGSWVYLVRQPHLDLFVSYQSCFAWMTFLALAQAIIWAFVGWPRTRALLLSALMLGIVLYPAEPGRFRSPLVLAPLYVLGIVLARVGLQKMRHGQWQGYNWEKIWAAIAPSREMRGPKRFASPAQAQLWYAWRRFERVLCFIVGASALTTVVVHLALRFGLRWGPLQDGTMVFIMGSLLALPVLLSFCFGILPLQNDLPFIFNRPETNGQIIMAKLKEAALGAVLSWVLVCVALGAMPLLGDFGAVEKTWSIEPPWWPVIILALVFLTWRNSVINLFLVWSGKRWLVQTPTVGIFAAYALAAFLVILHQYPAYWNLFGRLLPGVLACLVALKFLAAFLTFRVSLKRNLLAPSALASYLAVWALLAAVLLISALVTFHNQAWISTLCLGIVLLIPLARMGLCPITLAWNRHA